MLVVDDNAAVRHFMVTLLRRRGLSVIAAPTAPDAIHLASHTERLDLLVTDVDMPGGSGLALAARLAADRPGLLILVVSGDPTHATGLQPGARFLTKPFTIEEFDLEVGTLLAWQSHGP